MARKYLFLDRDGTLIREPADEQIDSLEKLEFMPGVFRNLYQISQWLDYHLVMVSNQDGLGTASYPTAAFDLVQNKLLQSMANEGIHFDSVLIDDSKAEAPSPNRKPNTGLVEAYLEDETDKQASLVIGDRLSDVELARNMGLQAILLASEETRVPEALSDSCILVTLSWDRIFSFLRSLSRRVRFERTTEETSVRGQLSLDGTGQHHIKTGLGFFDHMLTQIARHGGMDLQIQVNGDLYVDEHHTMEDVGLAMGKAFLEAQGNKKGLARYGFHVPMDDSQASCLIDLGGRPYLSWEVEWSREKIGDVPTEMFEHFFRSFADEARCNIHLRAGGRNEHHKIEAVFKAFARALRMALRQDTTDMSIPTTKGKL
ncbi:MAG: bifunctional histidinol-phosphatase/imidazoleglycerol-phosphate dehydratase HisB [Bacteroidales bacterium]|nr:bifunctional histidinol-phosphatase/imidazoleglycerol-phosphate dehydratase HisB [Bacteroidales bacterium]